MVSKLQLWVVTVCTVSYVGFRLQDINLLGWLLCQVRWLQSHSFVPYVGRGIWLHAGLVWGPSYGCGRVPGLVCSVIVSCFVGLCTSHKCWESGGSGLIGCPRVSSCPGSGAVLSRAADLRCEPSRQRRVLRPAWGLCPRLAGDRAPSGGAWSWRQLQRSGWNQVWVITGL